MSTTGQRSDLVARDAGALGRHLSGDAPGTLEEGYELAREAVSSGIGVLGFVALFQEAWQLAGAAGGAGATGGVPAERAFAFLAEGLGPFEMMHRGFREANDAIRGLNVDLQESVLASRKIATIVDATDDAVIATTLDGEITSWNPGAERLFGQRAERMVGRPVSALVPPDRAGVMDEVLAALSFSRPDERGREVLDLRDVVAEALKLLRPTLPSMIEISTRFGDDLPMVAVDATQIHQVIMNLTTNAAHAIGRRVGTIEIALELVTRDAGEAPRHHEFAQSPHLRMTVSDNGSGMDQATLERVFDPFFTTKPPGEGTGLGLSVVHGIVRGHGGAITAYSQPGKGTAFNLYLPAAREPAAAGHAALPEAPTGPYTGRILIVDDEPAIVALQARALTRLGYDVTGQTDPRTALVLFESRPHDFDAVVTDLSMPGLSGLDLARSLLAVRPDLPVLLTSGDMPPDDREQARRLGIREVIVKPDTIRTLTRSLARLLGPGEDG